MTGTRATIDTFDFASLLHADGTVSRCPICRDKRLVRCPNCGPGGHHRDGFDADGWCRRCDCGPDAPLRQRLIMCPCDDL